MAQAKKVKEEPKTKTIKSSPKKVTGKTVTKKPAERAEAAESEIKQAATETKVAKAGKRSAKAVKEAEQKQVKEELKATAKDSELAKPKPAQKPPRSRLERRGKNYRNLAKEIDKSRDYTLAEAVELAAKTSPAKFDATVEMHMRLNVDPKQADQNIRDTVILPAGSGKTVRVAVIGDAAQVVAAQKAGADITGEDDFLAKLDKGQIDFDILIASPAMMPKLGKYARLLGPKGLMPNPKSGTVTTDTAKAVEQAKAGRTEYRVDPTGIIHIGIGKVSFGKDKLLQNALAVVDSVKGNKPASIKTSFINSVFVSTTMGPSVRVSL